ncbi:MAG TPA: NAD(P)-dependent oxidoreductase [Spongiibacteraceae bacterium]|nr:short-chain dehydrogenase [Spongiibacteraceae bacterium]HCS27611.1 NAD(P)-dependent oxidoreductase [Spongiibacteraceae bacterium]|tara:strand:- start:6 stop:758 length:753 start_codon:yes stop_codon:yes gene_type:complete
MARSIRFEGKVVFITGAASGIGRACAERYAAEGARLYLCDINEAGLDDTQSSLATEVHTRVLNVSQSGECRDAIADCIERYGQLDVLCNIAGIAMTHHFHDIDDEAWDRIVGINLSSVMYLSRAAIPHLKESRGNIVNLASIAGVMGQAYTSAYCATKAAVVMLTKSIALEYAKAGIRCNALCPGGVQTPLVQKFSAPDDIDFTLMSRYMPLNDMAEADDAANSVLFLSSDEARHINGVALPLDGGVSAG